MPMTWYFLRRAELLVASDASRENSSVEEVHYSASDTLSGQGRGAGQVDRAPGGHLQPRSHSQLFEDQARARDWEQVCGYWEQGQWLQPGKLLCTVRFPGKGRAIKGLLSAIIERLVPCNLNKGLTLRSYQLLLPRICQVNGIF